VIAMGGVPEDRLNWIKIDGSANAGYQDGDEA
jgi:hypothetical protein